jgi:hypothetical protein
VHWLGQLSFFHFFFCSETMTKLLRNIAFFSLLASSALVGCDGDKETPAPDNKTSLLTASPWRMTAWTRTTGSTTTNVYNNLSACEKDDRYAFGTNGVLTRTEGQVPCGSRAAQAVVSTSPWNFNSAQTQLSIGSASMGATSITYDVVRLTSDVLQIRTVAGNTNIDDITYLN